AERKVSPDLNVRAFENEPRNASSERRGFVWGHEYDRQIAQIVFSGQYVVRSLPVSPLRPVFRRRYPSRLLNRPCSDRETSRFPFDLSPRCETSIRSRSIRELQIAWHAGFIV